MSKMKFNKNKNSDVQTQEKPDKKLESHDSVELSDNLQKAIKWLGGQLGSIRTWIGRDNRDYATITPKSSAKPPKPYETVGDVAQAVIDNLREVGEENGVAVFASYTLNFRNNKAVGRLISVTEEGKLVFALEMEYAVSGAKSGIQTMIPKEQAEDDDENVEAQASDAGFGKL